MSLLAVALFSSRLAIVSVSLLAQASPPAPSAPAAGSAKKFEFPTAPAVGEARLIEVRTSKFSSIRIEASGKSKQAAQREEETTRLVDTLLDPANPPKGHVWTGRRRYLTVQTGLDGVATDPELTGQEFEIWAGADEKVHLDPSDGQSIGVVGLELASKTAATFGLGVAIRLPAVARVGDEFDLPFRPLLPWCVRSDGGAPDAVVHLRLDSVDEKSGVALFHGPLHVEAKVDQTAKQMGAAAGLKGAGSVDGDVTIEYDVGAHRISRIVSHSRMTFEGNAIDAAASKIDGSGGCDTTITCSTGERVEVALAKPLQFRDVPREFADGGVVFSLPSHYFLVPGERTGTIYFSRIPGSKPTASVGIAVVQGTAESSEEMRDRIRSELVRSESKQGTVVRESTAADGKEDASAFEYTRKGRQALGIVFMSEPGRFVFLTCTSPESDWAERSKEWPAIVQSLKRLPAAK